MALSPQQIEQFRTQGFLKVEGFYSAREVEAMRREIERFKRVGLLRNVATEGDGKTKSSTAANLQLCPMYQHSTLFRALPFDDKVVDAVSKLIGEPIILRLEQVFLKPGRHGAGTSWHQDNAYFSAADPMGGTAMWISIHDANRANGTMEVIPGVFRQTFEHSRDPMSNHHIRMFPSQELEGTAVPIEMKAGGVVFFCYGTPHCTRGNTTDRERAGVAYHFIQESAAATMPNPSQFSSPNRTYYPDLNGPNTTGGERQYGVKVAGTWRKEVEQALQQEELAASQA